MLRNERLEKIMNILKTRKVISTEELQSKVYCSRSTLRRDLIELEKMKKVKRNHGSVSLVSSENIEFSYISRVNEKSQEKKYLTEIAEDFIGDNQAIFLDASSTVYFLCEVFEKKSNPIVITNGLQTAQRLNMFQNVTTYCSGGELKFASNAAVGELSTQFFDHFKADIAFISCRGVNTEGLFEANQRQALVKQRMIKNADSTILLCDHSKFNTSHFFKLADFHQIDSIITDREPDKAILEMMTKSGCEVLW